MPTVAENPKSEDLDLVRRVQAGDKSAFDLLVLKYQHKVACVVARYVRDNDEVQDVSQEAFIRAYRGLKTVSYTHLTLPTIYSV